MAKRNTRTKTVAVAPVVRKDDGGGYRSLVRPPQLNYSAEMMGTGGYIVPQTVLQTQYMANGFARLICAKPAEELMRAGFEIESEDIEEDVIDSVKARFEELDVVRHFIQAIEWKRAFGGSLMVMGLADGGTLETPLNEQAITAIDFLRVYDCFEAFPESRYTDPNNPKYAQVEYWKITPSNSGVTNASYLVHETRILQFDGENVPNSIRNANNGWGASVIQTCIVQLRELSEAHRWSTILLKKMQQAVHGIPDLSNQDEDEVTKRLNIVDRVRNAENTIAIDSLETYEVKNLGVSGVVDVVDRKAEALAAVCEIPMYVLMGRSVGGLNSTGESNQSAWHNKLGSMQNNVVKKPLDRLITFQLIAEIGNDGGDYTIKFNPLSSPSDKDQADIDLKKEQTAKTKADTLAIYMTNQVMEADEVRDEIRADYDLIGDAPEPEAEPIAPVTLNPGQKLVAPEPGQHNPAPAKPPVGNR